MSPPLKPKTKVPGPSYIHCHDSRRKPQYGTEYTPQIRTDWSTLADILCTKQVVKYQNFYVNLVDNFDISIFLEKSVQAYNLILKEDWKVKVFEKSLPEDF